jgi:hypothetical protein
VLDRIERRQRGWIGDRDGQPPVVIELEPEKWAAFPLDGERLLELVEVNRRTELDYDGVGLAPESLDGAGKPRVASALRALAGRVETAVGRDIKHH